MTSTNDKDQQRTGTSDRVTASAYAGRSYREGTPSASSDTDEQAARSVMHPESYDPEWRYYHGAWGG